MAKRDPRLKMLVDIIKNDMQPEEIEEYREKNVAHELKTQGLIKKSAV